MSVTRAAFRYVAGAVVALFFLTAAGIATANAQDATTPKVAAFLANPGKLLKDFPHGGPLMTNIVQTLALSDPSTFSVLLGLLRDANDAQKGGIGEGLAQAAKIEVLTNQALAEQWQQQIALIDDAAFKTAATNAFGDVQLGAVGVSPFGGFGGGPGKPVGPAGSTFGQEIPPTPVTTPKLTITSNTVGGPSLTFQTFTITSNTPTGPNNTPTGPSPALPVSP